VQMRGPEALVRPRPFGCSLLAPCPPSPGPRSDGPTPGGYAARCPVPVLGVLGSSVKVGNRTPTMPPRHRPGTWPLKPIRDASMFREPTPLWAFATTREDAGYLLENRGLPQGSPTQPSVRSIAQLACWMAVSSSRLSRASSSILRRRGPTSTAGRIRISARP
jgi:hypothetical protein